MNISATIAAARRMDWQQVVLNGGPPCFHLEDEMFCGRAKRWEGHNASHIFVSLAELLQTIAERTKPKEGV